MRRLEPRGRARHYVVLGNEDLKFRFVITALIPLYTGYKVAFRQTDYFFLMEKGYACLAQAITQKH